VVITPPGKSVSEEEKFDAKIQDQDDRTGDVEGASHICKNTSSGSFLLPSSSFLLAPDSWLLTPIFSGGLQK